MPRRTRGISEIKKSFVQKDSLRREHFEEREFRGFIAPELEEL